MKLHPTPRDRGAGPSRAAILPSNGRRRVLHGAAALVLVPGLPGAPAQAASLRATPPVALGPFYPSTRPADSDADLTQVAGRSGRAQGTILYVTGRVLDTSGRPVGGAVLELWQANAFGRYLHPRDSDSSGPLDPDFQGYGTLRTAGDGAFRIKTIKPPPYSGRTPHIHFIVASGNARLTTQMFFEGEAGNERDGLYRYLSVDDRRASTGRYVDRARAAEDGSVAVVWDVVLPA
jgi:protocatechuate 3,4-dioxygenase beta subunit